MQLPKMLIACGGREVEQDRLIEALWPDADGDIAYHAFETTLYRLRKFVGSDALSTKSSHLTLDPRYCWVDCWTLERLLSSLDQALDTDSPERMERDLAQVFSLYHGPFLEFDSDIPLAARRRERLRNRLLRVLDKLDDYWSARGEFDKAAECYRRVLEVDPCVEAFYLRLMTRYAARGLYPEALAAFERCQHA